MQIDYTQQTESGPVRFRADLTEDEVSFFIEYAITDLMRKGCLPMSVSRDPDDIVKFAEISKELQ